MSRQDSGYVLSEVLVAVGVISLLLVSFTLIASYAVRTYGKMLVRAELQQEIGTAFQRVMGDCLTATEIKQGVTKNSIYIVQVLQTETGTTTRTPGYWIHEEGGVNKLVYNANTAPITGNHALAQVQITDFGFSKVGAGRYRLWLTGYAPAIDESYTLASAVYLSGQD